MLRSYLTIAIRNLWKYKGFSLINLLGLSVGVAVCLLIVDHVRFEWSFDRFHTNADQIYRAWVLEDYGEDQQFFNTVTPIPLGPALTSSFPEIEHTVRVATFTARVQKDLVAFDESIHLADPAFFEIFDFPLEHGQIDPLHGKNTVVLTPQTATRYFGEADPVGQSISIRIGEREQDFMVTGVTAPIPLNSSIQFAIVVPWQVSLDLYDNRQRRSWGSVIPETYVMLREGTDASGLTTRLPLMVQQHVGQLQDGSYTVGLQPLKDIHLNPDFPLGMAAVSDPAYAYILSVLALLVLGIACINVVILSVAISASRNLEVGVRKVMGAERTQIMQQFWGESIILALMAVVFGIVLGWLGQPYFNDLVGAQNSFQPDVGTLLLLIVLVLVIGLVAGGYPALVLPGFHIVDVLKGSVQLREGRGMLRQGLVVLQFAFAVFLISSTLIMNRQLQFLQNKNLGFDKEHVVVVPLQGAVVASGRGGMGGMRNGIGAGMELAELFKNELSKHAAITNTGAASFMPGTSSWFNLGYQSDAGEFLKFQMNVIDPDFLDAMDMELVAGRNFTGYGTADANRGIIVNETLVATYGWEDPLGQQLPGPFGDHEVIGVVRDFHFQSLHTAIEPVVMVMNMEVIMAGIMDITVNSSPVPKLVVRITPGKTQEALAALEGAWNGFDAGQHFNFSFLDERIDSQYRAEQSMKKLVVVATLLSIFIACLGLFGQAALTVARRQKEIGIRKVLGASAPGILMLLSKGFIRLVLIAFVIVTPISYLVMDRWLEDFAYRIGIGPGILMLAGLLSMAVALLTVSFQSFTAARKNPVDSLRYE